MNARIAYDLRAFLRRLSNLRRAHLACAVAAVLVCAIPVCAQTTDCSKLAATKTSTYGFHPTDLSNAQQTAKSAQLDLFWNSVKSEQASGIKCLQQMIVAEKTDTFFLFDAGSLLYSLDHSPESLAAITQGINGSDLKDLQIPDYIRMLLRLNRDGVDIGPLAAKYLYFPKVDSFVPQHSMQLTRKMGVTLLYGSMSSEAADRYLIPALSAEPEYVRSAAALFLAMNMTPEDFRALRALKLQQFPTLVQKQITATLKPPAMPRVERPAVSREQVLAQLRQIPNYDDKFPGVADNRKFMSGALGTLTKEDVELIRAARQKSITGVSDEALDEYIALSQILLGTIERLNLFPDARGISGTN
jgi:hypothetical protein